MEHKDNGLHKGSPIQRMMSDHLPPPPPQDNDTNNQEDQQVQIMIKIITL